MEYEIMQTREQGTSKFYGFSYRSDEDENLWDFVVFEISKSHNPDIKDEDLFEMEMRISDTAVTMRRFLPNYDGMDHYGFMLNEFKKVCNAAFKAEGDDLFIPWEDMGL